MQEHHILKACTFDGVFTVLVREIFSRGGVIYGYVWDDDYNTVIKRAEIEEETMHSSKYM